MTETNPQEPVLTVGADVLYWPHKRPLLAALPATIVSISGHLYTLDVQGPKNKFRATCALSPFATTNACTRLGTPLGGEFDRSDKAKLEPNGKAGRAVAPAPVTAPSGGPGPGRGGRSGSRPEGGAGNTDVT